MESTKTLESVSPVVFFDSDCLFCTHSVVFIHKRLKKDSKLRFAKQNGSLFLELSNNASQDGCRDSLALLQGDKMVYKFRAIRYIIPELRFPYNWLGILKLVPLPVANFFYSLFAKHRLKLNKKLPACTISEELRDRIMP